MVLTSKCGRIQPETQIKLGREQDVSRKPLEVSRDALRAEPLVAYSAVEWSPHNLVFTPNGFNIAITPAV